jgi:hypothetical protein
MSIKKNFYSWPIAREAFYEALKSNDSGKRIQYFNRMFRSLGQVAHLLQDMAVPAHVRNDMKGHLSFQGHINMLLNHIMVTNWYANNFEAYVKKHTKDIKGGQGVKSFNKLTDYWDADHYRGENIDNNDVGLAEYAQANFLSENRLLGAEGFSHPAEGDGAWEVTSYPAEDGITDFRVYFKKQIDGDDVALQTKNYFSTTNEMYFSKSWDYFYMLDEKCYEDYMSKLVPKAVDYSTGLINYFFRGTLEISMPDRYLYSIADGSLDPQQFTYIKANVRNSTDYNGGPDAPMGPGKLWAVAKYKKRKNYANDLSNDPPRKEDRDEFFSYSVSTAIEDVVCRAGANPPYLSNAKL